VNWFREIQLRIRALFRKRELDAEMDEEMRSHVAMRTQENIEAGMNPDEARYAALRQFGWVESIKETCRDQRGVRWLENLIQDLRFAARQLRKNPGFTAVAVLTLALGIGANTAVFSVIERVLIRPLPYRSPHQLVMIRGKASVSISPPNFLDYQAQNHVFEAMATFNAGSRTLTENAEPERIRTGLVTAGFFEILGIKPILGRTFLSGESEEGRNNVVVLSHSLWRRRFGANPDIIGQLVTLDKQAHFVIGVLPPDFAFSVPGVFRPAEMWAPAILPNDNAQRGNAYLRVIARLRPGVTMQRAQMELDVITQRLAQEYPQTLAGVRTRIVSLHDQMIGNSRTVLSIMLTAVALVLLIACANIANLQLARSSVRQKEMVVRAALGANRNRMVTQLLTESVFLALLGGMLGFGLAWWGTGLFSRLGPANMPVGTAAGINWIVLAFSTGISASAGILFGLAPTVQLSSLDLNSFLKERSGGPAVGVSGTRLRSLLMIAEVAVSVILLIEAGLLIRSFVQLQNVNPGFATKNLVTIPLELPHFSYPEPSEQATLYRQAIECVGRLPGVEAVGGIDDLPLTSDSDAEGFTIEGQPPFPVGQTPFAQVRKITAGYFRTMRIPIIRGRSVSEQDTDSALPVIVINQSLARRFFPEQDPVGRRMKFGSPTEQSRWMAIAGVVGDVRDLGLDTKANLEVYVPCEQNPSSYLNLVIRAKDKADGLAAEVREEIRRLDKNLPLLSVRSMEAVLVESLSERQFLVLLLGVFAGLALLLAAIGVYGVISYAVSRQTRQIGIRMALGAQFRDVLKLVLKKAIREALLGVVIGLAGALALTRIIKSQLYEVSRTDPITFCSVVLLLFVAALIASWLPARRAAKINPMVALRYE